MDEKPKERLVYRNLVLTYRLKVSFIFSEIDSHKETSFVDEKYTIATRSIGERKNGG